MKRRGFIGALLALPAALRASALWAEPVEPVLEEVFGPDSTRFHYGLRGYDAEGLGSWKNGPPAFDCLEFTVGEDTRSVRISFDGEDFVDVPTPTPGRYRVPFLHGQLDANRVTIGCLQEDRS